MPVLGLLTPTPGDEDRAQARRVLLQAVEARGRPEDEVIKSLLDRLGS